MKIKLNSMKKFTIIISFILFLCSSCNTANNIATPDYTETQTEKEDNLLPPVILIKGGQFEPGLDVSVTIDNPNDRGRIIYTLDGTLPDSSSKEYTSPFTVLPSDDNYTRLTAAVCDDNSLSDVATEAYEHLLAFDEKFIEEVLSDFFKIKLGNLTARMLGDVTELRIWGVNSAVNIQGLTLEEFKLLGYTPESSDFETTHMASKEKNDIKSLNDILKMRNLVILSISNCNIVIIPEMADYEFLSAVILRNNLIDDINGLADIRYLKELNLSGNRLGDVSILENLNFCTLQVLDLSGNNLGTLFDFSNLDGLNKLNLDSTGLADIGALEEAGTLDTLILSNNHIADIRPLRKCNELEYLDISNNDIKSMDVLKELTGLIYLDISGNPIDDISILRDLTKLKTLVLSKPADQEVLSDLTWVDEIILKEVP